MRPRTLIIGKSHAGKTVAELLTGHFRLSDKKASQLQRQKAVRLDGAKCLPNWRVRLGQTLEVTFPEPKQGLPKDAHGIRVRFADDAIVVVEKPAGLTTVRHASEMAELGPRARKFLPPSLVDLLPSLFGGQRIRAVHRLDKETSGLLVLARSPKAESHLGKQFRDHSIERTYLALVRGRAEERTMDSYLLRDRGDGRRGSGLSDQGQHAITHIRVVEQFEEFAMVECRLETGRTHQVRIHLGEAGFPLCGETIYDRPLHGTPIPDASGAKRPMLHAASLAFDHPTTGERLRYDSPLPEDMRQLTKRSRRGR